MSTAPPVPRSRGPLFYIGSLALLAAMTVDTIAVVGRHLGINLLGSIELVQAAMLLSSSAALVAATLASRHASVHLLIDRLPARARALVLRLNAVISIAFFLALAAGSVWIALDTGSGHERSDLLHLPFAPLRLVSIAAVLGAAAVLVWQGWRSERE